MNVPGVMPDTSARFVPTDGGSVVDRETGLAWEQNPALQPVSWAAAARAPDAPPWRLPTASELLVMLCGLPAEHPFPAPAPGTVFWSATESPFSAHGQVRAIGCQAGPLYVVRLLDKRALACVWRVRDGAPAAAIHLV